MYTARRLKKIRKKMRLKSKDYVLRLKRRTDKKGLLGGAPMGRGSSRRSYPATAPSTTSTSTTRS